LRINGPVAPPRRTREPKNPKSCHERALGLLAVRPRSRRELEQRLLHAGFDAEEVTDVLGRLEGVGLIDDAAFARQFTEHQERNRCSGRRAVTSGLLAKGIDPGTVQQVVSEMGDDGERAEAFARSRASRLRGVEPGKAFTRLTSLLVRRGYDPGTARRAARVALEVDAGDD
jgi:regulatory protein